MEAPRPQFQGLSCCLLYPRSISHTPLYAHSPEHIYGLEPGAFIYIADSSMVTEKNLKAMGEDLLFISRLPANYKECRRVIKEGVQKDDWEDLGVIAHTKPTVNRPATYYKAYESEVTLYGENYRSIVIHSSAHDMPRQKRIDRELKSEKKALEGQSAQA